MMSTEQISRLAPHLAGGLTPQADAEKKLWKRLRHHQLGVLFRRRQLAGTGRIDFYCPEAALVVVIDGTDQEAAERAEEERRFRRFGLETLHFGEPEIRGNIDRVVVEIFRVVLSRTARPVAHLG